MYNIEANFFFSEFAGVNFKRNDLYLKAFGSNLRKLRTQAGSSMVALALEADIEYSQIAKIELGKINTTISTVWLLAKALNISPEILFRFHFEDNC